MRSGSTDKLFLRRSNILPAGGESDGTVLSCNMILARNITGYPFPQAAPVQAREEIARKVFAAAEGCGDFSRFDIDPLLPSERQMLCERRLADSVAASSLAGSCAGVAVSDDEKLSVLVNGEDHLHITLNAPGMKLRELWHNANSFDDLMGKKLDYVFDHKRGFLTARPEISGTGMRASVIVHLPGLVMTDKLDATRSGLYELGFDFQSTYSNDRYDPGNIYTISNRITLGESEGQIIDQLCAAVADIAGFEKNAREEILASDRNRILDFAGKAYGVLKYSYKLSYVEAMQNLSGLMLGAELQLFRELDVDAVNTLFISSMPGHLQKLAQKELDLDEAKAFRATMFRSKTGK